MASRCVFFHLESIYAAADTDSEIHTPAFIHEIRGHPHPSLKITPAPTPNRDLEAHIRLPNQVIAMVEAEQAART
jgi:hypothetical protein